MNERWNLHVRTTEFAWTHSQICMDKQRNWLGQITFTFGGFIYVYLLFLLCCQGLNFIDLGHDQQQHPTVHSVGELAGGGSVGVAVGVSDGSLSIELQSIELQIHCS